MSQVPGIQNPEAAPPPPITVAPIDLRRFDAGDWDKDAVRSGASMRSAHAHLKNLWLKFIFRASPRVFSIYLERGGERVRIGHYTLIQSRGSKAFYDGLNLYPEYRHRWGDAMAAALDQAGPGAFEYGWQWTPEPPRESDLQNIAGVDIITVRPILIQGVDFSNWPNWEAYYADISENARRNAKKAEKVHGKVEIEVIRGLAALKKVPTLVAARRAMYRRKGLPFHALRIMVGYVLSILACPAQAMIVLAIGGGRLLAIQNNVEFGDFHYYLDGAAANDTDGGAWFLQLAMLKHTFQKSPYGKFLMGYTDLPVQDQVGEGLLRSRRSLRVSDWPSSLVRFSWNRPRKTA